MLSLELCITHKTTQMRNLLLTLFVEFDSILLYKGVIYLGIGKTLSDILKEKNTNPNELAENIGVTPSTIYSIIKRDNMKVDITVLSRICKQLNVKMERFYTDYVNDFDNGTDVTFSVSEHEKELIIAYRQHPEHHFTIDTVLGVEPEAVKKEKLA